jgi:hypothetical protein
VWWDKKYYFIVGTFLTVGCWREGVIFLVMLLVAMGGIIFFSTFLTISFLKVVSFFVVFLAIFWIGLLAASMNFIVFLKCFVSATNQL